MGERKEYHYCVHEVDWGAMQQKVEQVDTKLEKVLVALQGNGKEGLVTKIALHQQSLKRIWALISVAVAGIVGAIIYKRW